MRNLTCAFLVNRLKLNLAEKNGVRTSADMELTKWSWCDSVTQITGYSLTGSIMTRFPTSH